MKCETVLSEKLASSRSPGRRGFGLLELVLVLGVIAIVTVATLAMYPRIRAERIAQQEAVRYTTIRAKMTASLGNLNYYAFPNRQAIIDAGILTEEELTSAYGPIDFSAVYPTGFSCTGEAGCTAYSLLYRDVPSEFCATLIPKVVER